MLIPTTTALLSAAALSILNPAPDTWAAFANQRVVAADGRHYVVVKAVDKKRGPDGIKFELAVAKPGTAAVTEETDARLGRGKNKPHEKVVVRPGDKVIARGELGHQPMYVHVSATGKGFIALDTYARLGYGDTVVSVDASGKVRFKKTLADLFSAEQRGKFMHTVSSIWWMRAAWLDDKRGVMVLAARGGGFLTVDIETGKIEKVDAKIALTALDHGDSKAVEAALAIIVEDDLDAPSERVWKIAKDETYSFGLRMRAALTVARTGNKQAEELLFAALIAPDRFGNKKADEIGWAFQHLYVLGDRTVPVLRYLVTHRGSVAKLAEQLELPGLVERLEGAERPKTSNWYAVDSLARLGSHGVKGAFEILLETYERNPNSDLGKYIAKAIQSHGGDREKSKLRDLRRK